MSNTNHINALAKELNDVLNPTVIGRLFSKLGERLYFPKGIIAQSAEAKKLGKKANATIGMALQNDKPLILSSLQKQVPAHTAAETVAYAPTAGNEELRHLWLSAIKRKNPRIATVETSLPVLVPGLTAGISYLADLFLGDDKVLITTSPAWDNYKLIVEARRNAILSSFSTFDGEGFNIEGFRTIVQEEAKTGAVRILLNFPQNPSGYSPTSAEIKQMVEIITDVAEKGADVLVWCDDAYFGLSYEDSIEKESLFAHLAQVHERVLAVKIDGPTKEDYVWGLRIGFLTFAGKNITGAQYDALVKKVLAAIRSSVSCANTLAQSLMITMLTDPSTEIEKKSFEQILERRYTIVRACVNAHKDHKVLRALPFNSGYFMSFECIGITAEELRTHLLHDHEIGTIAIDAQHLRVAYSSIDEEKIQPLFKAIYDAAESLAKEKK